MKDKFFASVLLIFFSPFIAFFLLIIYLEDDLPVIFKQTRIGINNSKFTIYKIRTLKNKAPNIAKEKINENNYNLKFGKILRKTHLDELPQLYNILKGDIKFIGYRPALPTQKKVLILRDKYGISNYKPGLTGWAQLFYHKKQSDKEKVILEKNYYFSKIKPNSKIIFYTILKMFNVLKQKK